MRVWAVQSMKKLSLASASSRVSIGIRPIYIGWIGSKLGSYIGFLNTTQMFLAGVSEQCDGVKNSTKTFSDSWQTDPGRIICSEELDVSNRELLIFCRLK